MKWVIWVALLASVPARSEELDCKEISRLAELIMQNRQEGHPMQSMMEKAGDLQVGQRMIIAAYESRRYHSEGMQKIAVQDFRDANYLGCIKSNRR